MATFLKLPIWHFFLLLGFLKFLWLNNFFLSRPFGIFIKHIGWKILLTQENPKFSVTERLNLSFLIFPSTEFDFFNFFSILTSPRIPGNQNLRLLISFLLLFQNNHSELGVNYIPHWKVLSSIRGHSKTNSWRWVSGQTKIYHICPSLAHKKWSQS